ncbi:calcium-binding protein [Pelagimonas sp. KU-00592-HH]|uniref:calcium-binding protein n=1 Tax=Pelagimonas sp. KU-00592-HH TaxID=3127651 RepID=UPI00333FE826
MTTYTFSGTKLTFIDRDRNGTFDDVSFSQTEFSITTPRNDATISYSLVLNALANISGDFYHMYMGNSSKIDSNSITELSEYTWGGFRKTVVLSVIDDNDAGFFSLEGADLPRFTSVAGYQNWINSATAQLLTGDLAPGETINLSDFGGVSISQHDYIRGATGHTTLSGGIGNDTIVGNSTSDRLMGGKGADELNGGFGNDTINGDKGYDHLEGSFGNDKLLGGKGRDTLDGGRGNDTLNGNLGADTFSFRESDGVDTIFGFQDDIDTIRLTSGLTGGVTNAQDILDTFGQDMGKYVKLDFGSDEITIRGIDDLSLLVDDLVVV